MFMNICLCSSAGPNLDVSLCGNCRLKLGIRVEEWNDDVRRVPRSNFSSSDLVTHSLLRGDYEGDYGFVVKRSTFSLSVKSQRKPKICVC